MLERDIEKILVKEIKAAGGLAYKFVSPGNDGVPDRIVILPGGEVIFVELKTDTGRLTKLQTVQVERIRKTGATVWVVKGLTGLGMFFSWCGLMEAAARVLKMIEKNAHEGVRKKGPETTQKMHEF